MSVEIVITSDKWIYKRMYVRRIKETYTSFFIRVLEYLPNCNLTSSTAFIVFPALKCRLAPTLDWDWASTFQIRSWSSMVDASMYKVHPK